MSLSDKIFIPKGNLGIPRRNMPQIVSEHLPKLLDWLKAQGINFSRNLIKAKTLKPTQKEINQDAVLSMVNSDVPIGTKPFLVTKDNFILDGHHRWLASIQKNKEAVSPVIIIDLTIREALATLKEFPLTMYKDVKKAEYNEPDINLKMESIMAKTEKEIWMEELQEQFEGLDISSLDSDEVYSAMIGIMKESCQQEPLKESPAPISFKEFVTEARFKSLSPDDPIMVQGFGRVKVSQLDGLFSKRFKDVEKFVKKKDWKNVLFLLDNTNIIPILKALKQVQEAGQ